MIIAASDRLNEISEYYFSKKLEQIRRMNEAGRDVVNLGIGSPDLAPSAQTLEAASKALANDKNHGYASYRGTPQLRKGIADWYLQTYGVQANADTQVLPLLGSKEGLLYVSMAFLNPGDRALVPNPGYPAYASATRLAGAKVVSYSLRDTNSWQPDFDELEAMDLSRVKIMWVNYPHMPTGQSGSDDTFRRLIEFGRKHHILICHDNPYGQVLNTKPPTSLLSFDPKMEVSLELNSFSKAFNMAGWRVGMMVASAEVLDTVLKVKSNVDSGMFLPVQAGAVAALTNPASWHASRNSIYAERRSSACRIFDELGFSYARDQVGLFIWAKAPDNVGNVEALVDDVLERTAVFITPGFIFGTNGSRYARCSLCAPIERFQLALKRLEDF